MTIRERGLTRPEIERLARALFEEEERMLPEGETWADLSPTDRSFYVNGVVAVLSEMRRFAPRRRD